MLAPLTCAVVMLISGVAKVGRPTATRDAFLSMGVPRALRSETLVTSLPYVEIALGVLLLVTWSWPLAVVAAATTALFAAYWVLVLRVLRRGEEVDCGCFGALGDDRVSGTTLARNSVLVVLGALATAFGAAGSGVVPAVRDFGTDGLVVAPPLGRGGSHGRARGGTAPTRGGGRRRRPARLRARPIPFALLEDESGTRVTLTAAGRRAPPAVVVPEHLLLGVQSVAEKVPGVDVRARPGRDLHRLHRAAGASPGQDATRRRSICGSTSSRAPPTPSPADDRPPSCWGPTGRWPAGRSPVRTPSPRSSRRSWRS